MPYRIYLRDAGQVVTHKTITTDPQVALVAFRALVDRTDLDGKQLNVVLNRDGREIAHHNFCANNLQHNWRGRDPRI